ncbi:DEAD/DEAH box helicase family protein [Thiocapsa sp. N5-Cardenillas]|uniref:DEAD/DEAH box helicase family protein n=1 Tax=Thiocapsa sp. N5-Cardenillas TaxID=3137397 RepID=UPI0035B44EF3
MQKSLRPYQQQAVNETWEALKKNSDPVLFVMSVGGGKSICISSILKTLEDKNKRALCLVNSAELVRNNSTEFKEYGGNPSVFCASIGLKEFSSNIIFATPQSVMSAIKRNHPISNIRFNMIVVDEAHGIAYKKNTSTFMRILRHYRQEYPDMRLLGLTGTPYRLNGGESESIVGKNALFKAAVANIDTAWLVDNKYLVPPVFGLKHVDDMDMSALRVDKKGFFKQEDLNAVVTKNKRLTYEILQEVQKVMQSRNGAFIFCSTIPHCIEAMEALPPDTTRLIIGDTIDEDRHLYMTQARAGKIKYLVSVSCLLVGVNIPRFDTSVFLRPTQSLTLFIQAIGRCLRLYPGKKEGLVLDFASNLTRFSDIDNPIINEALQPREDHEEERPFKCYVCSQYNSVNARRCCGVVDGKRCDHFFEFKSCPKCALQSDIEARNDITARYCRTCGDELIDPNAKLSIEAIKPIIEEATVLETRFWTQEYDGKITVRASYKYLMPHAEPRIIYEHFSPLSSAKAMNVFYGAFVSKHMTDSSKWYPHLHNPIYLKAVVNRANPPIKLKLKLVDGKWVIYKKVFA